MYTDMKGAWKSNVGLREGGVFQVCHSEKERREAGIHRGGGVGRQ